MKLGKITFKNQEEDKHDGKFLTIYYEDIIEISSHVLSHACLIIIL